MISFPNQKLYIVNKKIEDGDIFIMLKWDEYCKAARELSPSALNLYMYLTKNKDGYEFYFSSKDYCDTFKVVDKTYRNAKNELIKKGYLKENGKKVNFSSSAAFKETKENLKNELLRLATMIKTSGHTDLYEKIYDLMESANLKSITDDNIYKNEIKKLIQFAEEIIQEFIERDISNLL